MRSRKAKNIQELKLEEFENQVKIIHDELYIFLYSFIHEENLTKDVLQNTLIKAYNHYDSLNDKCKFKSWIFTIGKREAMTALNMNKCHAIKDIDENNVICITEDSDMIPEDAILNSELKRSITEAINNLKAELKEVILLKYYHGISFEKIAQINNINVNTVRSRHMRAKKYLSDYLKKNYFKSI